VAYHTHATDGRVHCDLGSRSEQPQVDPTSTITMVLRTRFGWIQDQEMNWLVQQRLLSMIDNTLYGIALLLLS
jgi:hypothetical protein